jgi:hypothetical protein
MVLAARASARLLTSTCQLANPMVIIRESRKQAFATGPYRIARLVPFQVDYCSLKTG